MDQAFCRAVNLTIVALGGYLCLYGLREHRAALFGFLLIAFGGVFALLDHRKQRELSFALAPPDDR